MFNTPILMLVFNRLETTQRVFQKIKEIQPKFLYVVADGARTQKIGEKEKCEAVRQLFLTQIDWVCELKTLFRAENLGCRRSVASGISWFFENVEQGIILEDDCLPDLSFFTFCQEMLLKYQQNPQIMHISGSQLIPNLYQNQQNSYIYTKIPYIWGWATWRRAWQAYDAEMSNLNTFLSHRLPEISELGQFLTRKFLKNFHLVANKQLDTWDYQWTFSIWYNNGACIAPTHNLISNIGFGADATHTATVSHLANQPTSHILPNPKPINSNPTNFSYDKKVFSFVYGANILVRGWRWLVSKF
jgi:hypothetical protein